MHVARTITAALAAILLRAAACAQAPAPVYIDLAADTARQVIVDREPGQYLGHPTTVLLDDNKTILCVYPKGHGKGPIVYKRSTDAGKTWGERLPTPDNWATSLETPTLYKVTKEDGKTRLLLFSGLYPIRLATSEDLGNTWSPLAPIGNYGGIVAMASLEPLHDGTLMALFHDDGRFLREDSRPANPPLFVVYRVLSKDQGQAWGEPEPVTLRKDANLCEPGLIRSPDHTEIAVLLRENSRTHNSMVIFSKNEALSWSIPRELNPALTGDRHTAKYAPDGRLLVSFRDTLPGSPTHGDWLAWVGTYQDILDNKPGQYRVRLMHNTKGADCAYPGVEVLPDGTFILTTYGHWTQDEQPYITSVRLTLAELDAMQK